MIRMKVILLTILATCALSAAFTTSASAVVLFHASKAGTLKGKSLNFQVFNTGAGSIECSSTSSSGAIAAPLTLNILLLVQYSGCTAFGFTEITSNAEDFLLDASNGLVVFDNTLKFNLALAGCSISFPPQKVLKASYANSGRKIIELSNLSGIRSVGSGGLCGGTNTTGTWTGNTEVELVGGTIKVQ